MFEIFVNYRTADARFGAASAHEALVRRFGAARVFLDSVSIPVGSMYPDKIYEALDQVQVLTVLIGPEWLSEDPATGARPIDRLDDWVRREIRSAMEHNIVIIPVLLDGVSLPAASELPDDIRDLSRRQYVEVNHRSLGVDLVRLGDCVAEWVSDRPPSPARGTRSRLYETLEHLTRKRRWVTATVVAGTVLLLAWPPSANSGNDSVIGESCTADPCYLIDAAELIRFGTTRLDPAYPRGDLAGRRQRAGRNRQCRFPRGRARRRCVRSLTWPRTPPRSGSTGFTGPTRNFQAILRGRFFGSSRCLCAARR